MSDSSKMGPKEKMLHDQRVARAERAEADRKKAAAAETKKPSSSELREKIAAIKPKPKGPENAKKTMGRHRKGNQPAR